MRLEVPEKIDVEDREPLRGSALAPRGQRALHLSTFGDRYVEAFVRKSAVRGRCDVWRGT